MPRGIVPFAFPVGDSSVTIALTGGYDHGYGEDSASAPLSRNRPQRIENFYPVGAAFWEQVPDWTLVGTCENSTPVENNAVCGIFPFATQGGASAPSAGVAFSFNATDQKIYLHQLGEDGSILRTLTAYSGYTPGAPPQMTGVELFGKFYFCADGREAAASRLGMGVFDPTGAGTVTIPSYNIDGAGAGVLKFKGICVHRGGTLAGWGYSGNAAAPDAPHLWLYAKYTDPSTWVPDLTPTTAGSFVVGLLNVPIVACAASGQYTLIGKESEMYALDGDYSEQFYLRKMASGNGPVSTTGMTTTGPLAVWMSQQGPAYSAQGGAPVLFGTNRLTKRLATYFDFTYCTVRYQSALNRVGFLLRRQATMDAVPVAEVWPTQLLWWDTVRDAFYVHNTPTECFTFGPINGPGTVSAGPTGTPSSLVATPSPGDPTLAALTWSNSGGDSTALVSIEYALEGGSYTAVGPAPAGSTAWTLSGLAAATRYNWRLRYFKNGTYGAYAAGPQFLTISSATPVSPTSFTYRPGGSTIVGGKTYWVAILVWSGQAGNAGATLRVLENDINDSTTAATIATLALTASGTSRQELQSSANAYFWVQTVNSDGSADTPRALTGAPIQFNATYLLPSP